MSSLAYSVGDKQNCCGMFTDYISTVSQSEGLGRTNNHNKHNKGLRKGEWWCASMVPEGKSLMGKGMLLHQRDDADADRGHS